jgi:oxygen-dependent protoporphyrinogen oxidase
MSRSCVVVGAGPAGLSAAYRLANAGVRVTVVESDSAIGGRTRTERVGGFIINTGASFLTSFFDATLGLARELRLEMATAESEPGVVATPVGKLPLDLHSPFRVVTFPLISWLSKVRTASLFARVLLNRRSHIGDLNSLARMDRGGSVERWGRRWLGQTAYDYLLRSGIEPFFYFGAEEASAALGKALMRHALKWDIQIPTRGMGELCDALAQRLTVRTGCAAHAIEERESSVAVHHAGGTVEADYAVLAIPASAIVRLDGTISDLDRTDLATVRYVPNIVVFFGYERPITVQFPSVSPAGPGRHAIARVRTTSTWAPQYVPQGNELLSIYVTSWRSAELLDDSRDKIVKAVRADVEEIFGRLADPDWIRVYPRSEAMVLPEPLHFRRMQAFQRRRRQRVLYAGDWLTGSTIEGAVRTGLAAAERILGTDQGVGS